MAYSDADANSLIIVGAGGCGMMAALVAAAKGVSVLLLEKTDKPGGSTAFSSRGIRASGSRFQGALGIDDSPEQYARDIFGRNSNESDVPLTKRLTEVSGAVADFLADVACIDFSVGEFVFGHSARRAHSWKEDKTITDFMYEAVEREPNIQVRFSTSVLGFQQADDGTVTGVVTDSGVIPAAKVILASGGFGASQELLSQYIPEVAGVHFPGHHGSTGDGIRMGLSAGAALENMASFQPYPAHIGPGMRSVSPEVIMAGGIMPQQRDTTTSGPAGLRDSGSKAVRVVSALLGRVPHGRTAAPGPNPRRTGRQTGSRRQGFGGNGGRVQWVGWSGAGSIRAHPAGAIQGSVLRHKS